MLYSTKDHNVSRTIAYSGPEFTYINLRALARINSEYIDIFAGEIKTREAQLDAPSDFSAPQIGFVADPCATFLQNIAALWRTNPTPDALNRGLDSMQRHMEQRMLLTDEANYLWNLGSRD